MANINNSINYIEFPLRKNAETKAFYNKAFGWTFTDWGETYISFEGAGIEGGFNGEDQVSISAPGILPILYTENLGVSFDKVQNAGGKIIKPIFEFPGGKRFHFLDPNGNELAVWSDK